MSETVKSWGMYVIWSSMSAADASVRIMVPGGNQWLGFLRCEPNIVIPYKDIRQIGPDIILVDINC